MQPLVDATAREAVQIAEPWKVVRCPGDLAQIAVLAVRHDRLAADLRAQGAARAAAESRPAMAPPRARDGRRRRPGG